MGWVPVLDSSPGPALCSCVTWVKCLGKWAIKTVCKNDITLILCLPGVCKNKSVKNGEVLMYTTVMGPNKTLDSEVVTSQEQGNGRRLY